MSAYKPFDEQLFLKNDKIAKDIAIKHVSKKLKNVQENEDKYGPDVYGFDSEENQYFVETEIKQNWDKHEFPFGTLNIPKRKDKYLNKYPRLIFLVISKDLRRGIATDGRNLKKEYLKEVSNKYVGSGEKFYQIPLSLCKIVDFD